MSEGSDELPVITPEDFDLVAVAGRGAFGTVWVVRKKHDYSGRIMAMKALSKQDMMEREYVDHTVLEKEIMAVISDHPFCVSLFFTFQTETHLYIVMEYLPGGHLLSYVMDTDEPWADDKAAFYGGQTILALEHMHRNNVVYRDLKLENILLDMDGNIRLTDFGLSALLKDHGDRVHSMSGTAAYIAPEVLDPDAGHSFSADVWSFGVMMFILLLHESPFYSENTNELFEMIRDQEIDWEDYADELSTSALSLLKGLLAKKVEDRLGCGEDGISSLRTHVFFQGLDWEALDKMEAKPFIKPRLRVAERATPEDFRREMEASKPVEGKDPFGGFSFVAADYMDTFMQKDEPSLGSVTEAEESVCWPFPVKVLPISLAYEIIGYLGVEDVARASRVCKDWNTLLWSRLWNMDFSRVDPAIFAKYWTSRICPQLSKPVKLRSLTLNPGLKDAGVSKLPQIISLERLSLRGCTSLSPHAIQRLHRTVQNLGFTFSKKDKKKDKEKESAFGTQRFPFLSHLCLEGCTNLGDGGVEQLASLGSLTELDLTGVTTMTDVGMQYLKPLKKLEILTLAGIENITDVGLLQLHNVQSLREVELGGTSVTEDGMGALRVAVSGVIVKKSDWTISEDDLAKKKTKKKQKFGLNFRKREVSLSKKRHKRSRSVEVPNGTFEELAMKDALAKKEKERKEKKGDAATGGLDGSVDSLKRRDRKKHKAKAKKDGPESPEKQSAKLAISPRKSGSAVVSPRSPRDGEKRHRSRKEKKVEDLGDVSRQLSPTSEPEEGRKSARRRNREKRKTESLRLDSTPILDYDAESEKQAALAQEEELRQLQELALKQKREKAAKVEADARQTAEAADISAAVDQELEKAAKEKAAKEKAAKDKAAKERAAKEKAAKDKAAKEKAAKELLEKERALKERAEQQRAEEERAAKEAEKERTAKEKAVKEKTERAKRAVEEAEAAERRRQDELRVAQEAEEKLRKANNMQQKLKEQIKSSADVDSKVESGQARSLWHQREKAASAASLNALTGKPITVNRPVSKKAVPKSIVTKAAASTSKSDATSAKKVAIGTASKLAVKKTAFAEPSKPAVMKPVVRDDKPKSEEEAILLRSRAKRNRSKAAERTGARRSVSDIASIFARQQEQQATQPPQ